MASAPNYEAMYQPIADFAAQKYGIPSGLFSRLIASESSWNPNAVGPVMKDGTTAKGIAQFTNATARDYGVDTVDVTSSLMGAAKLLRDRFDKYGGDWSKAVASYKGFSDLGKGVNSPLVQSVISGTAYEKQAASISSKANATPTESITIGAPDGTEQPADTGQPGPVWLQPIVDFFKRGAIGAIVLIIGLFLIIFTIYVAVTRGRNAAVKAVPELARNIRK
jgi:hypothetical protein